MPRDIDQSTRDLLQCIFNVEPNLRISVKEMTKKSFFKDMDWESIRNKQQDPEDIPYKPNPNKYQYLLDNEYEEVSNLYRGQPGTAASMPGQTPLTANEEPGSASSPKKRMLGDFTIYKVNKEFDNF